MSSVTRPIQPGLRAIMVCVDYHDLLALTLPYNIQHFSEVWIITDGKSFDPVVETTIRKLGAGNHLHVLATELFYANGAKFNKWAALEWGLDEMGRYGWLCLMDADVLWPKSVQVVLRGFDCLEFITRVKHTTHDEDHLFLEKGQLCSPLRRMVSTKVVSDRYQFDGGTISEDRWKEYPIHRNIAEWAGYSQIFHAEDPHLGPAPWHETDWEHAGGADSFFQRKWPRESKVRPPFEVLHLGEAGANWYGRVNKYLDGTEPKDYDTKYQRYLKIWRTRKQREREGLDPYGSERITK